MGQSNRPKTIKEALTKARNLLVRGWVQNSYVSTRYTSSGREIACYCAAGAVNQAISSTSRSADRLRDRVFNRLAKKIDSTFNPLYAAGENRVIQWNDTEGRVKREVLALFDKAIAAA